LPLQLFQFAQFFSSRRARSVRCRISKQKTNAAKSTLPTQSPFIANATNKLAAASWCRSTRNNTSVRLRLRLFRLPKRLPIILTLRRIIKKRIILSHNNHLNGKIPELPKNKKGEMVKSINYNFAFLNNDVYI
jgi:hypothetical protein